jgi:tetratricopeptide (TPR) repeat protein
LPDSLRGLILERAEGNPFFLEEIIRALIEQGVLRRDGERWIVAGETSRSAIPSTVRGVLAARIDRLPPPAKTVLQHAAIIGRFFDERSLRALADDGAELDRALAHLLRAELIREQARLPERQYLFKHALTQDAAYASMLGAQRAGLHARVARHLEDVQGETSGEHAAILADHWDRAGEFGRALDCARSAAARARALYARPEAIQHHWHALELMEKLPDTPGGRRSFVDVVVGLVTLPGWARTAAERTRGLRLLEDAQRAAMELGDSDSVARIEAVLGHALNDEARFESARARAVSLPAQADVASSHHLTLGQVGRYDDALVQARRAIELYAAAGARLEQALQMNYGGRCWAARAGRFDESLAYAAHFRQMADELDDVQLRARRAMEAEPYIYLGRWHDAVRVAEEGLPIAFEIGEVGTTLFCSAWLGFAYVKLGRRDDARQVLDRALRWGETRINANAFAITYVNTVRALAHLADGEPAEAISRGRRALEMSEQGRFALERGASYRVLGQAREVLGERSEADASFRQGLEIHSNIQSLPELGQTLLAYGKFRLANDRDDGRRLLERARLLFEEIGATGWAVEAAAVLAASP